MIKGKLYLKQSAFGRIYSSFTSLDKLLRKAMTINGERIVEVDIIKCHPSLLYKMLYDDNKILNNENRISSLTIKIEIICYLG